MSERGNKLLLRLSLGLSLRMKMRIWGRMCGAKSDMKENKMVCEILFVNGRQGLEIMFIPLSEENQICFAHKRRTHESQDWEMITWTCT